MFNFFYSCNSLSISTTKSIAFKKLKRSPNFLNVHLLCNMRILIVDQQWNHNASFYAVYFNNNKYTITITICVSLLWKKRNTIASFGNLRSLCIHYYYYHFSITFLWNRISSHCNWKKNVKIEWIRLNKMSSECYTAKAK